MSVTTETKKDNAALKTAQEYATRGWQVFPVYPMRNGRCSCKEGAECKKGPASIP